MDNIESLMSKVSLSKPKASKVKDYSTSFANSYATNNSTFASSPDSFEDNDNTFLSPKSPVFRPQLSPNDMIPDMSLPESEIISEIAEDPELDNNEMPSYMKKKQHFSCPNGPTLNIWVGNGNKNSYGFEMIEENDADLFNLDDTDSPANRKSKEPTKGFDLNPSKRSFVMKTEGFEGKRARSQSENLTACTIFKFLEVSKQTQKRLL
mmetsp:Transcript_31525/g.36419  ORF Transcript_31525/g.36419 Transcript_31525/m.36419 type:complete len:208 (-) Transcript_31525:19-642(-)